MKTIQSRILGETTVDEKKARVNFAQSLLGFEGYYEYYLIDLNDDGIFKVLQSGDDEQLSFVVVDPNIVFADYALMLHDEDRKALAIEKDDDVVVYVIVTIPEKMDDMTANLQGPIVINKRTHEGRQCIDGNDAYTTRHPIVKRDDASV